MVGFMNTTNAQRDPSVEVRLPPVVCELDEAGMTKQVLEWSDLGVAAVSVEATAAGATATYPIAAADRLEDLVRRERACCGSWLDLVVTSSDDVVRVELVAADPEGVRVIHALAGAIGER